MTGAWSQWTSSGPLTVAPPRVSFWVQSISYAAGSAAGTQLRLTGSLTGSAAISGHAEYRVIGGTWRIASGVGSGCSIGSGDSGLVSVSLALGTAVPSGVAYRVTFDTSVGSENGDVFVGIMQVSGGGK